MATDPLRQYLLDRLSNKTRDRLNAYTPGSILNSGYEQQLQSQEPAAPKMDMPDIEWEDQSMPDIEWEAEQTIPKAMDMAKEYGQKVVDFAKEYGSDVGNKVNEISDSLKVSRGNVKEYLDKSGTMFSDPIGALDFGISEASNLVTAVVGGLAGLGALPFVGPAKATDIIENIQSYAIEPKTKTGKRTSEALNYAMEKFMSYKSDSDAEALSKIEADADKMVKSGELPAKNRQAYIDTMYSPVQKAIETGVWSFVPSMIMKAKGKAVPLEGEFLAAEAVPPVGPSGLLEGPLVEGQVSRQGLPPEQQRLERQPIEGDVLGSQEGIPQDRGRLEGPIVEGGINRPDLRIGEQKRLEGPGSQESLPAPREMKRLETDPYQQVLSRIPGEQRPPTPMEMLSNEIARINQAPKEATKEIQISSSEVKRDLDKLYKEKGINAVMDRYYEVVESNPPREVHEDIAEKYKEIKEDARAETFNEDLERTYEQHGYDAAKKKFISTMAQNVTKKFINKITPKWKEIGDREKAAKRKREDEILRKAKERRESQSSTPELKGLLPRKGHEIINNETGKVIGKVTRQEKQKSGNKIIHYETPEGKTDSLIYFKDTGNTMHTFVKPKTGTAMAKKEITKDIIKPGKKSLFDEEIHKPVAKDIKESMEDSIEVTGVSPVEWKERITSEIDDMIRNPRKGEFVTFDVQGDGKFKIKNTKEKLQEFKKKVNESTGFRRRSIQPHGEKLTDKGSNDRLIDTFLKEDDLENAYEAAKLGKNKPIIRSAINNQTQKRTYALAKNVEEVEIEGHKFAVGKTFDKGKSSYAVYDYDSGMTIGGSHTSAKKAAKEAGSQVKKHGIDKLKKAMKESKHEGGYEGLVKGLEEQISPKPTRGGYGGKQGGELNLGEIADGIKEVSQNVKSSMKAMAYGPISVASTIARYSMRAPADVIRGLGVPEAHKFADILSKPLVNKSGVPVKPDLYERIQVISGRLKNDLDKHLEPLRSRRGAVGKTNNDQLLDLLLSDNNLPAVIEDFQIPRNMQRPPQKIYDAAREVRKWLDDLHTYVTNQGIDVGKRMRYFPRIWDVNKIMKLQHAAPGNRFSDFLMDNATIDGRPIDRAMAERITKNIIDNDGYHDNGGFGYKDKYYQQNDVPSPTSRHFMSRKIEIDDKVALPWMETNVEAVLSKFADAMALRGEYARSFGAQGEKLDKMIKEIKKEYNLNRKGNMNVNEIEPFIHDISEAILNRKGSINNPFISKVVRGVTNVEVLTKLPLVALISTAELGGIAGVGRLKTIPAAVKVLSNSVRETAAKATRLATGERKIPKSELQESLERLGHVTINALEHASTTRFTGRTGKMTALMMRVNLHDQLTNFQRSLASQVAMEIVRGNAKSLSRQFARNASTDRTLLNRRGRDQHKQLVEMGIDPEQAVEWFNNGMTDSQFTTRAQINSVSFVNQLIQRPNPTRTPTWMFSEKLSWLYLFKKFSFSFTNNYLTKMLKEVKHSESLTGKTQYALGALMSTGIAYLVMKLKDQWYYGSSEENPFRGDDQGKMIMEAIDRAGYTGYLTFPMSVIQPRYGYWDDSSKRLLNLMGPAITDFAQALDALRAGENAPREWARFLSKNVPSPIYIAAGTAQGKGASEVKKEFSKDLAKKFGQKNSSRSRSRSRSR